MFACPTRRALLSCASHAPPAGRRLVSTATAPTLRPQPQKAARRYSSSSSSSNSKPFGPNNRGLAFRKQNRQCENGQTAQTSALSIPGQAPEVDATSAEKAPAAEETQKIEEQKNSPLPFVARTDHLRAKDIHASTFFALHRPVSVKFPVPGVYTNATFQKLFDEPSPLSTIELHKIQQEVQARQPSYSEAESAAVDRDGILNPDEIRAFARKGSLSQEQKSGEPQISISSHPLLLGDYTPFNPPPPPEPITEDNLKLEQTSFEKLKGIKFVSSSASGQEPGYMLAFFDKSFQRQGGRIQYFMRNKRLTMFALSVKRQRKLKMKKHKYKKLMKRTRTLRRKLEKQ
ncbi:hypothetical protein H072_855 [Dactylellina haptotyla CBS 200.50]|uniref:Small ribosomal subunit protein mS38 n=1 Tax=Dactylellina haptotyla (strain CBS 200.50) TaxID=1284197 RepID=S8C0B1_DACHA|nr:hypothetical protein H072_855 [Dactylellina haptotyla CBS 200.50]